MKKLLSFLLVVVALLLASCKKDSPSKILSTYTFPAEAKAYLLLPKGPCIYKNASTGKLDTMMVVRAGIAVLNCSPHTVWEGSPLFGHEVSIPGYDYEHYEALINYKDDNVPWITLESVDAWYETGPTAAANISVNVGGNAYLRDSTMLWYGTAFFYPAESGLSCKLNSYTVEGTTYADVLLTTRDGSSFYWAKGVGIIQCVLSNSTATSSTTYSLMKRL